jgi:uncharacterized protein
MDDREIQQVEASLGIRVPDGYRDFLLHQAEEIGRLRGALDNVVTPWTTPGEFIRAHERGELPGQNRLAVATNGAGDFWFLELAEGRREVWHFEHETEAVALAYAAPADWLEYLRERLERQTVEADIAEKKAAREFAELTFSGIGISSFFQAAQDVESTERLAALIAAGHDVDTPNRNDSAGTPLMAAVSRGNEPAVRLLLEAGADAQRIEANGSTALHQCGRGDLASRLLRHGADPNAVNQLGMTPLHSGAFFGREEVVRQLLDHGADKSLRDAEGQTPHDVAVARKKENVIGLLQ